MNENKGFPNVELFRTVCALIVALPTEQLAALLDDQRRARREFENVGHIIDPTYYRDGYPADSKIADTVEGIAERIIELKGLILEYEELVVDSSSHFSILNR
jgi:hypothetical protein